MCLVAFSSLIDIKAYIYPNEKYNPSNFFKQSITYKVHHNVTIVTAYYNLHRPDRSEYDYLKFMAITLRLQYPMIIFCRKEHISFVQQNRKEHMYTTLITNEMFPLEGTSVTMSSILLSKTYNRKQIEFSLPTYIPLQFSKFIWLKEAMKANPYHSDYFYWIDAGLGRFFTEMSYIVQISPKLQLFNFLYPGKVTMQYLRDPTKPIQNVTIGSTNGIFAGGVFGGWHETLFRLSNMALEFYNNSLLRNHEIDNEQVALAILYHQHPSMFYLIHHQNFDKGHCSFICI